MTPCEQVTEDLSAILDGDRDVIARHADHLASCDHCRDTRHDAAQLAKQLALAGADYVPDAGLHDRLLVAVDREQAPVAKPAPVAPIAAPKAAPRATKRRPVMAVGAAVAALAATGTIYMAAHHRSSPATPAPLVQRDGSIGKLAQVTRAAADKTGGVDVRVHQGAWRPLHANEPLPAGAELRTDERTRTALDLADGTHLVLDHATTLEFDANEPRRMTLASGRIVADVAHVEQHPASVTTPNGTIDVVGTRFEATAAADVTSVQVVRGAIVLTDKSGAHEQVRAGEEGMIDHGALSVSPAPSSILI